MLDLFAGELRRLRTAAGLSQEALAEKINFSPSLVAAVEQCRRPPRREFTQKCDEVLSSAGLLLRIRDAIVRESVVPWFREWAAIEREARALRSFQPLVLPGLFQTQDYAYALCATGSPLPAEEVDQIVAGRMARQEVLTRTPPPLLVAVVDYTVLERPIGGPQTMREQLHRLIELGERPNIHIHVVPKAVGGYTGLSGPFVLASPFEGNDVAYLDNQIKGTVVDLAAEVRILNEAWEAVRAEALPKRQTLSMISEAANQWT
ncbi:helix-turn-helix domain-containing protein [Jidongwangia harbinensis]|uniref:helix-turn-helix domain-containing protein n=1 Tax=Jidongwangia harbinensis TaxID=2878561 RepID=UPI001CD9828D|nr:helix-turn-helix transcriptional regulator [Jidongwangia harbinensis]MCA2213274.1 helix-turn-helix transcriptional regulator [Jidongwangia harbinensis]